MHGGGEAARFTENQRKVYMKKKTKKQKTKHNGAHLFVCDVRKKMQLTQDEFAALCGVHALTVSKWERGILIPGDFQTAIILTMNTAASLYPAVGRNANMLRMDHGLPRALFLIFSCAYGTPTVLHSRSEMDMRNMAAYDCRTPVMCKCEPESETYTGPGAFVDEENNTDDIPRTNRRMGRRKSKTQQ